MIAGVVIGGTSLFGGVGTILGTVVGLFIPAVLQNGFVITGVQPFWQQVAVGVVLITAVYIDQVRRAAAPCRRQLPRQLWRSSSAGGRRLPYRPLRRSDHLHRSTPIGRPARTGYLRRNT